MSILHNINYMTRFVFFPCATPNPLILIDLAAEALLPELWEFFSYQVVQTVLPLTKALGKKDQPRYQARREHDYLDWKRSRGHGRYQVADPPTRRSYGEKWGPNTFLFRAIDLEQKAAFYWMILDLATEFMARWTTLIYQYQGCPFEHQCYAQGTFATPFHGQGDASIVLPILSAGTVFCGGLEIQQQFDPATNLSQSALSVMVTATFTKFLSLDGPAAAWIEIRRADTGERLSGLPLLGALDPDGFRKTGAVITLPRKSASHRYNVVFVNNAPEFIECHGTIHISSGFCVTAAPLIPFDAQHILPRLR